MEQEILEAGLLSNQQKFAKTSNNIDATERNKSYTASLILSTFIAVCGSLSYGCAMGYSSPAESGIMEDLGLSVAQYSIFASNATLGGMLAAVFSGKIAAIIGRKKTMWFSSIFCTGGWLAIAFAQDIWLLDAGRLSVGIGVGLISYVVPVYIAEIAPKNIRGRFSFSNQLMQSLGTSLAFLLGNVVHWRILALISAVPGIVQILGLFFIPESPRWLAMYRRGREFETTLQCLRGKDADISEETADIREIVENFHNGPKAGVMTVFQRQHAHPLIVGVGLMLLQQLVGSSGVTYYASSIFEEADFSTSIGTTILAIIMVPKALLVLFLLDKCGRRPLLMISCIGLCFCSFLLGLSFFLKSFDDLEKVTSVMLIVGVMGYIASFAIGMGGIPWVIMSEIFPADVKVSAGTLVTVSNWFFSWVVVYSFSFMLKWSSSGTFFIFSSIAGAAIVFVWGLVPETKRLTLEEIQASFSRSRSLR